MSKVLVVDSSLLDRKRIRNILEAAGHQVLEAEGPQQAFDQLAAIPRGLVKLLVTEVSFPNGEDGLAFIRQFRADRVTEGAPVLVVTGRTAKEDMFAAIQAGASNVVGKPFGGDLLLRRVTETLAESGSPRLDTDGALTWRMTDYVSREIKRCDRTGSALTILYGRISPADGGTVTFVLQALEKLMRASDILTRSGEDGFILLLPDTDVAGARVVRDRMLRLVERFAQPEGDRPGLQVRLKLGAATYPEEGKDGDVLLLLAEDRAV